MLTSPYHGLALHEFRRFGSSAWLSFGLTSRTKTIIFRFDVPKTVYLNLPMQTGCSLDFLLGRSRWIFRLRVIRRSLISQPHDSGSTLPERSCALGTLEVPILGLGSGLIAIPPRRAFAPTLGLCRACFGVPAPCEQSVHTLLLPWSPAGLSGTQPLISMAYALVNREFTITVITYAITLYSIWVGVLYKGFSLLVYIVYKGISLIGTNRALKGHGQPLGQQVLT